MEDKIITTVCDYYGISTNNVLSKSRLKEYVKARQIICYLYRKYTDLSLFAVGTKIMRDHASVSFSVIQVNNQIEVDKTFKKEVERIENILFGVEEETEDIFQDNDFFPAVESKVNNPIFPAIEEKPFKRPFENVPSKSHEYSYKNQLI